MPLFISIDILVLFEIELVSFVDQAASDKFSEFPPVSFEDASN